MNSSDPTTSDRHAFLTRVSHIAMGVGLVTAYGTLAAIMARFLYPSRPSPRGWMFVATLDRFARGGSLVFRTPGGETVNITRDLFAFACNLECFVDDEGHAFFPASSTEGSMLVF